MFEDPMMITESSLPRSLVDAIKDRLLFVAHKLRIKLPIQTKEEDCP